MGNFGLYCSPPCFPPPPKRWCPSGPPAICPSGPPVICPSPQPATSLPLGNGSATTGGDITHYALADHVHPSITLPPNTVLGNVSANPSFPVPVSLSSLTLAGDASGPIGATVVGAIQGTEVSATVPTNGDFLQVISGVWTPMAAAPGGYAYYWSTDTSIITNGSFLNCPFAVPSYPLVNGWTKAANNTDFTASVAGLYRFSITATFDVVPGNKLVGLALYKNGSPLTERSGITVFVPAASSAVPLQLEALSQVLTTDIIQVRVFTDENAGIAQLTDTTITGPSSTVSLIITKL